MYPAPSSRYKRTQCDPNKEKVRNSVRSSITQALNIIDKQNPVTYPYLKQGIQTGHILFYTPHSGFPSWELNIKT